MGLCVCPQRGLSESTWKHLTCFIVCQWPEASIKLVIHFFFFFYYLSRLERVQQIPPSRLNTVLCLHNMVWMEESAALFPSDFRYSWSWSYVYRLRTLVFFNVPHRHSIDDLNIFNQEDQLTYHLVLEESHCYQPLLQVWFKLHLLDLYPHISQNLNPFPNQKHSPVLWLYNMKVLDRCVRQRSVIQHDHSLVGKCESILQRSPPHNYISGLCSTCR